MTIVFAAIWLAGVALLVLLGVGFAATVPLMQRRAPDDPENPLQYGMPGVEVTFASRDGLTLGGYWIAAQASAEHPVRGTVIMCPGQNGSLDSDIFQAKPLWAAGFNVLLFDFRAHGRSDGELVTLGALEQADLFGALDYVEQTHGVDRVGVLGFSMGAGVALLVAAQDARIGALVVDGAFPSIASILRAWLETRGFPGPLAQGVTWLALLAASLRTRYQLWRANPVEFAPRVQAPALFIHGEQDPFVSNEALTTLAERVGGPVEVWRVAEAGHRQAPAHHPEEYPARVVGWFERYLAGDAG